ncbi:DUF3137 domain-containing protein [Elioraea sp.]|uniref:DUF3137 domain-containing protein n=1 Tax=Elioraea sp. TaxID=2185103 RepID=UPI003F72AD5B
MTDAGADRDPGAADAARHERLDALLNEHVAPKLAELRGKQRRYRLWALLAGLGGPALAWISFEIGDPFAIFFGLHAAVIGPGVAFYLAHLYRKAARDVVTPVVCEAIGGITHHENVRSGEVGRLRRAKLVAPYNTLDIDDVFQGTHDGVAFVMMELHLKMVTRSVSGTGSNRRSSTRTRTIFRGLMFMIATPRAILVPILIRGQRRRFGTPWRLSDGELEGMQRIDIPDEAFARHLSLWTSDGDKAAEIVTPQFVSVMAMLAASAGRKGIDAAFDIDQFLLLLPRRGDQFKVGGLFRSVRRLRIDAHGVMDEILMVHRLIETLKGG